MWRAGADLEGFTSETEVEASLPANLDLIDAHFLGGGPTQRILCWTSQQELWDVDFSREGKRIFQQDQRYAKADDAPRGNLARVLGERSTAPAESHQLLQLPVRTTPAQQAGLTPHLLERIIPPSAPSHLLPPPAIIWSGVLATWGKPLEDATLGAVGGDAAAATNLSSNSTGDAFGIMATPSRVDLPSWARKGPLPPETCRAELADAAWMDQLVQEAMRQH
jgi:hypothetical protein